LSYSDDYPSPAAPFSGDETGEIFDAPDVVSQSPTTNERVVDTQSGFLVVVRRIDSRVALSVKRRIGTPPTSTIALTPDESLKLSIILADHVVSQNGKAAVAGRLPASIESWLGQIGRQEHAQASYDPYNDDLKADPSIAQAHSDASSFATETKKRARRKQRMAPNRELKIAALAFIIIVLGGAGFGLASLFRQGHQPAAPVSSAPPTVVSALDDLPVDKFCRTFVSEMLDFNPQSYRLSQVQAMSHMSPTMLDKYWQETNFPISKKQLSGLPQGQTLMITKVSQERISSQEKDVDLYAELVSANSKVSNAVHLKIRVATGVDNELKVTSLQDLSSSKK
jgi:hypothetical protein